MGGGESAGASKEIGPRRLPAGGVDRARQTDETNATLPNLSLKRPPDDIETCVICLEPLTGPCKLIPCAHYHYHLICIEAWLSSAPGCPICKAKVSKVLHGRQLEKTKDYTVKTVSRPLSFSTSTGSLFGPPVNTPRPAAAGNLFGDVAFDHRVRRHWTDIPWLTEPFGLSFRREVYRRLRYSKHVGSNPHSGYRELSQRDFQDRAVLERARMFLRRELRVFGWLTTPEADTIEMLNGETQDFFERRKRVITVESMMGHILRLLQHFEIRGSDGGLEDVVARHLGRENTQLLLHELHAFLRSPYERLEDWDRAVQYHPLPASLPEIPERQPRQNSFTSERYSQRYRNRQDRIRPARTPARVPAWHGGRRQHSPGPQVVSPWKR
ncbi:RING-type E3 ubiquitin transferase [Purpureocillium takamizusanense]|uniref:RING-type E3 ubiquitin transferase n=1 Tax=Purpureocillium takamizusanense TaxID=2060973 RepID=A0A9Q8QD60_9HYPO|nr:RING-type E3 ubiquitin transferase [Purpureocillium takamizusanense]UNI17828.1 RING-type E3 ubiquitin transferase [Purpureocillium takamizusanense]